MKRRSKKKSVNFDNDGNLSSSLDIKKIQEEEMEQFVKNSPRWKRINKLNQDIENESKNVDSYGRYLTLIKRQIKQDEQDLLEQEQLEKQEEERAKNFKLGIISTQ